MVSRGCWAEQPQSCSSSSFKERNFSHSPESWVRVALPGRRRICGPSFSLDILRLQRPEAYGPGLLRAGPSGEERCTLHHTVPISFQCHQEIGLPTLPVFQGAAFSSEHFTQSLPPRNVAEPGGSPPLWGSLAAKLAVLCQSSASGHRASHSKYTRGQSRETGSLSRSPGGVGAPAKLVSLGPAWADSGSVNLPRRWRGSEDRRFHRRLLRQS